MSDEKEFHAPPRDPRPKAWTQAEAEELHARARALGPDGEDLMFQAIGMALCVGEGPVAPTPDDLDELREKFGPEGRDVMFQAMGVGTVLRVWEDAKRAAATAAVA